MWYRPDVFSKKGAFRNSAIFTGKYLTRSLCSMKMQTEGLQFYLKNTPAQYLQNTFFIEHYWGPASVMRRCGFFNPLEIIIYIFHSVLSIRDGSRINFRVLQNFTKKIEHRNDVICRKIKDSARNKKVQF